MGVGIDPGGFGFESVSFAIPGELIITQGDREALEIEALSSDLPNIVTEVRDGTLTIGRQGPEPFSPFRAPVFRPTVKHIAALETHRPEGSRCRSSPWNATDPDHLVGRGLRSILRRRIARGPDQLSGRCAWREMWIGRISSLPAPGSYSGGLLASRGAVVRLSSSGSATLRVSDSLEAVVTSSGSLRYYGNPPARNLRVTSSGKEAIHLGELKSPVFNENHGGTTAVVLATSPGTWTSSGSRSTIAPRCRNFSSFPMWRR